MTTISQAATGVAQSEVEALRREVRRLRDHEEIRQLLYRYVRGVDRANLDVFRSVYAEGGTHQHGQYDGSGSDFAPVVIDKLNQLPGSVVSAHHITNIFIQVDGDEARTETYFFCLQPHDDGNGMELALISGRYLDVLKRENGEWGIHRRVAIADRTKSDLPGSEWARTSEASGFVQGKRGDADLSATFFS